MNQASIDIEQPDVLANYLRDNGYVKSDEPLDIQRLSGGVSNRTLLVCRSNGESWVVKQALAKLRVEADWFSDPQRIHLEALGLKHVAGIVRDGAVPELIFEDQEQHIIAMRAVPTPHENWKTMLLRGDVQTHHVEQFAILLASIHRHGFEAQSRMSLIFHEYQFFESLRLSPYYEYTMSQITQASDFLGNLIDVTRGTRETIVHGDYSPKNILVHQDNLVLLDYEVIHFGDPAFDVGFSMTHLLSKAHYVNIKRQAFADAAKIYWQTYVNYRNPDKVNPEFEIKCIQHTLACLLARVAGKSQLEYMDLDQRIHQQQTVLALIHAMPHSMPALIDQFIRRINNDNSH